MMKFRLVIFMLVVFTTPVFAQTSLLSRPAGERAIGLGLQLNRPVSKNERDAGNYQRRFRSRNIRAALDYHFNRSAKVSLIPGIAFLDIANQRDIDVPPSPSAEVHFITMGEFDTEKMIDYFFRSSFRADYALIHSGGRSRHYVNTALTGGMGFIGKLRTATQWQFYPFGGVFYSYIWRNTSTVRYLLDNDTYSLFTGEVGVEIQVSPMTHLIGSVQFSFETSEIIYSIGLSFR
ncbi:hypothetical protein C6503_03545 [Candidatus Poribacteria bacterium]|nr:MAG: hypothetical protein C6503_03545 [Candidatus Poribacteria bacterium]